MKISRNLPQFDHRPTLVAILGKQVADFYLAYHGRLEELVAFAVATPRYSDREGFFMTRTGSAAGVVKAGAPYDNKDHKIRQDFTKALVSALQRIDNTMGFEDLYVFSPNHYLNEVINSLPSRYQRRLAGSFSGNYYKSHPFTMLQIIGREAAKPKPRQISREVRKILERVGL